jgi:putative oxidoreductase
VDAPGESRPRSRGELVARALLALPFLADGVVKVADAGRSIESISGMGLPFPQLLNYAAAALELAGGACLLVGVAVTVAALVLAAYLIPASFLRNVPMAHEHPSYLLYLARDLGLVGGLLLLARLRTRRGCPPGAGSQDLSVP